MRRAVTATFFVAVCIMTFTTDAALQQPSPPRLVSVTAESAATDPALRALVDEVRGQADAFVFLAGGASKMAPEDQRKLLTLFEALALVARAGTRLAVGDGGTRAGIMEAAGLAREASGRAFALVGVAPAPEIPPRGKTPVDPNHSHVVAVDNPAWNAENGWWGSETTTMYGVFRRLSEGRPSAAVLANGGAIALTELEENLRAGRPVVVIAGSGRAADAIVSLLMNTKPTDPEVAQLRARATELGLTRNPSLLRVVNMATSSPAAFATALNDALRASSLAR